MEKDECSLLGKLTSALAQCPSLRGRPSRRLFQDLVEKNLGRPVGVYDHENAHYFHVELAAACQDSPALLDAVVHALSVLDEDSADELRRVCAELIAAPVLPSEGRAALRTLLRGLSNPRLAQMCGNAVAQMQNLPVYDDMWSAFEGLSLLNARPDGLPPALALVEYIAAEAPYDRGIALREWNDAQAARLRLASVLGSLRQRVAYRASATPSDAYLVVRLVQGPDPESYELTSWRHYDAGHADSWQPRQGPTATVTLAEAEQNVCFLVQEAEETWAADADTIHLEFLLATESLTLPVHLWRSEFDDDSPVRLCQLYPVVVRSLDRSRRPWQHRVWRKRWETLWSEQEMWRSLIVGGPDPHPPHGRPDVLEAMLRREASIGCVVLSDAPHGESAAVGELNAALRAGVPVLLWGQDPIGSGRNRSESSPVVGTDPTVSTLLQSLPRLRQAVRESRLNAQADLSSDRHLHVGHRLVLLWDDPTRQVETPEPLAAPGQRDRRRVGGQ